MMDAQIHQREYDPKVADVMWEMLEKAGASYPNAADTKTPNVLPSASVE